MDYNLIKTTQGAIEYNIDQALPYGDMPPSMLMSKFEETDMGPDEDVYDDYARTTLTDWRPDTNKFEHEEARGGVNRSSGRLQLQYYGHRGNADPPYRPEIFDGFGGPEDHDPRGINVDPDMKELRKQHDARMRFVRWDPDSSKHITGGGRSESQVMADQQKLFRITRDRLKVFSRQIDGRQEGLRRTYKHKSEITKQILVQSYGDYIKDYALNPQRRANIICKQILRDSRQYREECADQDFEIARYTQLCRRKVSKNTHKIVANARHGHDSELADGDGTKCFKAAGLLMANIVRGKKQGMDIARQSDMDFSEAKQTVARKTEPFARDLALILRSLTIDGRFEKSDNTMIAKTSHPVVLEHLARQVSYNHLTPAHHYLNAEVIYKSVKPGADTRKVKNLVITDANAPEVRDVQTRGGKTAKMKLVTGAKLKTTYDEDATESSTTFNYKLALNPNGDRRIRITSGEDYAKESDDTQNRSVNHQNYRSVNPNDTVEDMRFSNNTSKERHTRGLGTKYMTRFIDRDERRGEISADN